MTKPTADLSLDLDDKWSYLKTHGDSCWSEYPSYLDRVIPLALQMMFDHSLKITVFVVGQDAALVRNRMVLRTIADQGHEIGNHSFHHEPWLERYSRSQLEEEFDRAEQALAEISDRTLKGFRGPGYSFSSDVLELLCQRNYLYDASTLPTFLGPVARAYYFYKSNLSSEQSQDRKQLFGSFADGFRRLAPYRWTTNCGEVIEMPVTTMPLLRIPFHFSYILYLAQYSESLALSYFRTALRLCRWMRTPPSLLLHPLDFLGGDEVAGLDFFPAMKLSGKRKRKLMDHLLREFTARFEVVNMANRVARLEHLPAKKAVREFRRRCD